VARIGVVEDKEVCEVPDWLSPTASSVSVHGKLEQIGQQLARASRAIAFTGAGISTESGLPDYRGSNGLWHNERLEELAHVETFQREPAAFWRFYSERLATLRGAAPNAAHRALARLEEEGLLAAVITQNVDGLHQAAGSRVVFELHGSLREGECSVCREAVARQAAEASTEPAATGSEASGLSAPLRPRWPIEEVEARLAAAADGVPRCDCGSPLKPAVVLFGESLPVDVMEASFPFINEADYALCLGSTLEVAPAAALPQIVLGNGGTVAIINIGRTDYDDERVCKVEAPLAGAMPIVLEAALAAQGHPHRPRGAR
jgi:NAD-dependent protein deacetylase/lipoamidase